MIRSAMLLATLIALTGCSIQARHEHFQPKRQEIVEKSVNDLASSNVCCAKYSELQFRKTELGVELKEHLGQGQQAYEFPSGKSFVFAVQVPQTQASHLQIKGFMIGKMATELVAFYPKLAFLNHEHELIEEITEHEYAVKQEFFSGDRYFFGEFKLPTDTHYVVVFTSPDLRGKGFPFSVGGGIAPVGATGLFIPVEKYDFAVPYMLTGDVSTTFVKI